MTKKEARTLKQMSLPAVRWSDRYRQYFTRIGYRRSKSGIRQQAFHYLGKDEKAAVLKAAAIKSDWREVKRKHGRNAVWSDASNAPSPAMMKMKLTAPELEGIISRYHAEADADALAGGEQQQVPTLRMEQVFEQYKDYRKAKLGIADGQGINDKTYLNEIRNLKGALTAIDQKRLINGIGYSEIEHWRDAIFRRVGLEEISKRTANNYWGEARRMLDWSHRQATIPYRHPEDAGDLFKKRFRNANPVNIAKYDAEQLRQIIDGASERLRLYIYLALNCGYYQVDIGQLRHDEIIDYNGKTAIERGRSKTSHQNDFESLHILWDETAALLKRHLAGRNEGGLALLSNTGTPLYRQNPHCDIITDTYALLQKRTVKLPFKQYRKLGATAIQRIGGDEARRLYKAGTIDSGDKAYVIDAYEKLTPHLLTWGDELRKDGILYDAQK